MSELLFDQVKKKLRRLYLRDMAEYLDDALEYAQKNRLGFLEFLNDIADQQINGRKQRALERRLKQADFPRNMTFDNFDFNFQPSLNVEHLKDLMALSFVADTKPLLIFAKTGAGKTHIAAALGRLACQANFKVKFISLQKLLSILYTSLADDTTDEVIAGLCRFDLLIIDDAGNVRSKPEYPSLLLDLVSTCQGNTALILTSAISFEEWSALLGNPPVTHAIIDRLMHQAELINIRKALSYRTQGPEALDLPDLES